MEPEYFDHALFSEAAQLDADDEEDPLLGIEEGDDDLAQEDAAEELEEQENRRKNAETKKKRFVSLLHHSVSCSMLLETAPSFLHAFYLFTSCLMFRF